MAKALYVGVSGIARKAKKVYIGGTDGKAKKVKKMYIGDANGKARLFWSGGGAASRFIYTYNNTSYACDSETPSSFTAIGSLGSTTNRKFNIGYDRVNDRFIAWAQSVANADCYTLNAGATTWTFQGNSTSSKGYATIDSNDGSIIVTPTWAYNSTRRRYSSTISKYEITSEGINLVSSGECLISTAQDFEPSTCSKIGDYYVITAGGSDGNLRIAYSSDCSTWTINSFTLMTSVSDRNRNVRGLIPPFPKSCVYYENGTYSYVTIIDVAWTSSGTTDGWYFCAGKNSSISALGKNYTWASIAEGNAYCFGFNKAVIQANVPSTPHGNAKPDANGTWVIDLGSGMSSGATQLSSSYITTYYNQIRNAEYASGLLWVALLYSVTPKFLYTRDLSTWTAVNPSTGADSIAMVHSD